MDRWHGKIAVVTGASSGIGSSTVVDLIKNNIIVVGLARRLDRMQQLKSELPKNLEKNFYPVKCDVSNEDEVKSAFEWIEKNLKGVDILVNNAGIYQPGFLTSPDSSDQIKRTLNVNVMGVVYCTREAFKSMKKRGIAGHVILINSVVGHKVLQLPGSEPNYNIYPPSKFAITAMTEIYRQEFSYEKTKVKITSISPGLVDTEIVPEHFMKMGLPSLKGEDISNAIIYVLGTPPHVQIHELTIKPVGEIF